MAIDVSRNAITAIRDMDQEGFIAASLTRSGWNVLYRATEVIGLNVSIEKNPTALVIQSDDFTELATTIPSNRIYIRGRSQAFTVEEINNPTTDFELEELIRNNESTSELTAVHIPATQSKVIAVRSIGGRVGATTIAITIAEQLTLSGQSVLLVDGDLPNPGLADRFEINGMRDDIKPTPFGFDIFEVTNLGGLHRLSESAKNYDCLVIDVGQLNPEVMGARRVGDRLARWLENSGAYQIISARSDRRSLALLDERVSLMKSSQAAVNISVALLLTSPMNRKNRRGLSQEIEAQSRVAVSIISRDEHAVNCAELDRSTLGRTSPKSLLNVEIKALLEAKVSAVKGR